MKRDAHPLLVFDWDGTLMDSTAAIVRAIQHACDDLGLPVPSASDAAFVIGLGLNDALRHVVPSLPATEYPRLSAAYRRHYFAEDSRLDLFPGMSELLHELKDAGHALAVATGKSRLGLERALDHAALRGLFDATRTADETASKPHPAMLEELMAQLVYAPGQTLMIGDTTHDLQMAHNAGCYALAVSYGAHAAAALAALRPLAVVDSVPALRAFLLES